MLCNTIAVHYSYKTCDLLMPGQEKGDIFNTGDHIGTFYYVLSIE
jgi:hypothetical protein